jgi:membrane-associated phospholipid phosphatase
LDDAIEKSGAGGGLIRVPGRLRPFDRNLIAYLIGLSLLTALFGGRVQNGWLCWGVPLTAVAALAWVIPWLDGQPGRGLRFIRFGYLILALPFLYWYTGMFIHLVFHQEMDPLIVAAEQRLFGGLPNLWMQAWAHPLATEIMQIAYAVYWVTIPLGVGLLYFKGDERLCGILLEAITWVFFSCFTLFILFPVAGPRFHQADQIHVAYDGVAIGTFLRGFVHAAAFRGGAFPSLHVAAAVLILVFMWRHRRRAAMFFFLPATVAFCVATLYGQYHYLTDVVAGGLVGAAAGFFALRKAGGDAGAFFVASHPASDYDPPV